ncbi:phosphoribosyl-ATP diphosphatase [Kozakia baliensis]|uniref:phosphoribosyl-ATP diphosphatase n=1 Tax=Kozakia baliensis TaxID=153496 RepID=UPI0009F62E0E|nr:phosphoribosyl-ATP diphosphatase [Kozakia baliensis]
MAKSVKASTREEDRLASKKGSAKKASDKKTVSKKADTKKTSSPTLPHAEHGAVSAQVLDRLFDTVLARRGTDPTLSHSARLLARGRRKIAQKFGEEAVECLIEAVAGNAHELISESADVLYHLIVMWVDAGVKPDEVWAELRRREGTSGIAEKASRPHSELS